MAKRYFCIFRDEREIRYDIEIWDSQFSGTPIEFKSGPSGFQLRHTAVGERTDVFMPTECSIAMQMQDSSHEVLIEDLLAAQEGRFVVHITKGDTPERFWTGMVLPDIGRYAEEYYPIQFEIRATDGIGLLKDAEYSDAGTAYVGKERAIEHIARCLSKLPFVSSHYTASDHFIKSHVDWWEATMSKSASDPDALYQTFIDHATWWKYDKGEQKFMSCYQVIENILTIFGCRISYSNGAYWIEQITYRDASTVVTRRYSKLGELLSTANFAGENTINQTLSGALLAGGQYEFFPALSRAVHVFKSSERRNFLAGAVINSNHDSQRIFVPLQTSSGGTNMRLTGNLTGSTSHTMPNPGINQPVALIFRITLDLDTKSLKRDYTISPTYQVNYSASEWEGTPQSCYFIVSLPAGIPTAGAQFSASIDIEVPNVPENVASFLFGIELAQMVYFSGGGPNPANFTNYHSLKNGWLEVYSGGNPAALADEIEYETTNTIQTANSAQYKSESVIGSTDIPNVIGALWVKPASTYALAQMWGEGTDTPDREIEKILTELIVSGQHAPLRRLQGTLFGDIMAMRKIDWLATKWLLLGGTWSAGKNEFDGEWVEMDFAPGLNASPPKRRKLTLIDPPVPPGPTTGLNGAGAIYEIQSKPPGTLLYPVAQTTTDDEIEKGAITSIPVTTTLAAGDFYAGDTITIVNPITGTFESLTVTATSMAGDTSIAVSGTLENDYVTNAPIIKKPLIGTFSLPAGGLGQILRHDGAKWAPYGEESLEEGDVLTWSDATGWAAQSASSGNQTIALSGDATGSGTTSIVVTIAANAVTFAKMQQVATAVLLGRNTAGTGNIEALSAATVRALLSISNVENIALSSWAGSGSLSIVGTITTGTWSGTPIAVSKGGTGLTTLGTSGQLLRVNAGETALEYFTAAYLTGNQPITLSGDATGSGTTSIVVTIAANAVTFAKMQQVATAVLLGRNTAGTGNIEALSAATVRALLSISNVENIALSSWAGSGSLSIVGTITTGTWSGTPIAVSKGGTGLTTLGTSLQYLRVNSAGTALEYATLTASGITGSLTATRIPFATGASTVTDDQRLSWDNTNKRLSVGNTGGAPTASIHIAEGSVAGWEPLKAVGTCSQNMWMTLSNAHNASTIAHVGLLLLAGGTSGGDPYITWQVSGGALWGAGIDTSDSGKFKLGKNAIPSLMNNQGITMTNEAPPKVGINNDAPSQTLDVIGNARATMSIGRSGSFGSTFGGGAGTSPVLNGLSGFSNGFVLQFTTGTSPSANGNVISITLPTAFPSTMYPTFCAANGNSATDIGKFYISAATSSAMTLTANGTLSASTTYKFYFNVSGV